jgi:Recombination endonuclease VII
LIKWWEGFLFRGEITLAFKDREARLAYYREYNKTRRIKYKKNGKRERQGESWKRQGINITREEYEKRWSEQDGLCALCGKPEKIEGRRLAVDHDWNTGVVRGLLCFKCNTWLGWFEALAENVGRYLHATSSEGYAWLR